MIESISYVTYNEETDMPQHVFLSYAREDSVFAALWETKLVREGYSVFRDTSSILGGARWQQEIEHAVKTSLAVIVLVSPSSADSQWVNNECSLARYSNRPVIPVLIQFIDDLPWYVKDLQVEDATVDIEVAFGRVLRSLPKPNLGLTLGEARDAYLQRATLKSQHTIDAYRRSIELLFQFLQDRSSVYRLPIQKKSFVVADEIPLSALGKDDAPVLLHFAQWLLSAGTGINSDRRPYKPATVELRISGVQNWLQYLDDHGWLPAEFQLARAKRIVQDELQGRTHQFTPPQPPDHIEEVIYYYDTLEPPSRLRKPDIDAERLQRWETTRLRNRALLHALAETGGRISEVLSLNLADFPTRRLERGEVLRVEVTGKGGHSYYLRFLDSLPAVRAYIEARGADLRASARGDIPLFVSHDPNYDGKRMSRVVAWRVVQRAARALGIRSITPHDFRHWRATQLLNAGHPLDVVQDYLGHRSVETTRAYYAHTDPLRVDDAAKNTRLPEPEDQS
jgi:site-specific recombinase XerD